MNMILQKQRNTEAINLILSSLILKPGNDFDMVFDIFDDFAVMVQDENEDDYSEESDAEADDGDNNGNNNSDPTELNF